VNEAGQRRASTNPGATARTALSGDAGEINVTAPMNWSDGPGHHHIELGVFCIGRRLVVRRMLDQRVLLSPFRVRLGPDASSDIQWGISLATLWQEDREDLAGTVAAMLGLMSSSPLTRISLAGNCCQLEYPFLRNLCGLDERAVSLHFAYGSLSPQEKSTGTKTRQERTDVERSPFANKLDLFKSSIVLNASESPRCDIVTPLVI
jgi:hypothetical protein